MDAVIEIVQTEEDIGNNQTPREWSLDCYLWDEYGEACRVGWHRESYEDDGVCWNPVPTDECPGPGRYRLVRVEEE